MTTPAQIKSIYKNFQPPRGAVSPLRFAQLMNRRLLVVEDDFEIWPIIERAGEQIDPDIVIEFAANPDAAIDRMMNGSRYDAILVDHCLPNPGDGDTLRGPVESLQPWAGFAMMSSRTRLAPSSCRFLPKPFTKEQCGAFLGGLLR